MAPASDEGTGRRGGVVVTRAAAMFVVCMLVVGILAIGLILGVIPVQFGLSKNPFTITLDRLEGTNITAYVGSSPGTTDGMAIAGVEGGEGANLCLSTVLDLPLTGPLSIEITSGTTRSIPLDRLTAHGAAMRIDSVDVHDIELGLDAATLHANDLLDAPAGAWGLQMASADINNIRLDGTAIKVMAIQLRGLGLGITRGEHHCPSHSAR